MRAPTGTISNATVANRRDIFRVTVPKTCAIINHALNKEGRLKRATTMNRKSPYRRLVPSLKIALHRSKLTRYWDTWRTKKKQSKRNLSKSSGLEGIFQAPEPNGLGEGFML